jgi:hypothetical protein
VAETKNAPHFKSAIACAALVCFASGCVGVLRSSDRHVPRVTGKFVQVPKKRSLQLWRNNGRLRALGATTKWQLVVEAGKLLLKGEVKQVCPVVHEAPQTYFVHEQRSPSGHWWWLLAPTVHLGVWASVLYNDAAQGIPAEVLANNPYAQGEKSREDWTNQAHMVAGAAGALGLWWLGNIVRGNFDTEQRQGEAPPEHRYTVGACTDGWQTDTSVSHLLLQAKGKDDAGNFYRLRTNLRVKRVDKDVNKPVYEVTDAALLTIPDSIQELIKRRKLLAKRDAIQKERNKAARREKELKRKESGRGLTRQQMKESRGLRGKLKRFDTMLRANLRARSKLTSQSSPHKTGVHVADWRPETRYKTVKSGHGRKRRKKLKDPKPVKSRDILKLLARTSLKGNITASARISMHIRQDASRSVSVEERVISLASAKKTDQRGKRMTQLMARALLSRYGYPHELRLAPDPKRPHLEPSGVGVTAHAVAFCPAVKESEDPALFRWLGANAGEAVVPCDGLNGEGSLCSRSCRPPSLIRHAAFVDRSQSDPYAHEAVAQFSAAEHGQVPLSIFRAKSLSMGAREAKRVHSTAKMIKELSVVLRLKSKTRRQLRSRYLNVRYDKIMHFEWQSPADARSRLRPLHLALLEHARTRALGNPEYYVSESSRVGEATDERMNRINGVLDPIKDLHCKGKKKDRQLCGVIGKVRSTVRKAIARQLSIAKREAAKSRAEERRDAARSRRSSGGGTCYKWVYPRHRLCGIVFAGSRECRRTPSVDTMGNARARRFCRPVNVGRCSCR